MTAHRAGPRCLAWVCLLGLALLPASPSAQMKPNRVHYFETDGQRIYMDKCAVCHMPDGRGRGGGADDPDGIVDGFPPLTGMSEWLSMEQGQRYVAHAIIFGPYGEVLVGDSYYYGMMPRFMPRLNNQQIVAVVRFIAEKLNKPAPGYKPINEAIVQQARKLPDRMEALAREREQLPPR